ncbi:VanZ family protein [Fictibacillus terranigra]|uniref:VanZ family protein n=1 Tax=Fictibacillus terranigra TaxID=3058424 RepID=A0ABT8E207_9BACL|nr:VanZ family protein [Fictibacillus sp. CENA-BCM004]MDN4071932.1 VanZ family protein [Fictibacillus sp. CENA-BCM004]
MKRFIFYWLPVLLVAGGIFYSSATPYQKQDMRPTLSHYLDHTMIADFFSSAGFEYAGEEVSVQALGPAGFVEFLIRKLAHFSVYFLLAFLLYRALRFTFNRGKTFILSFILTVAYAASDEIHQHFTSGRSPHVEDVMIDATGGLAGLIIAVLIYWRHFRRTTH